MELSTPSVKKWKRYPVIFRTMMKTGQTPVSNHETHCSLGPDDVSLIETRKMLTRTAHWWRIKYESYVKRSYIPQRWRDIDMLFIPNACKDNQFVLLTAEKSITRKPKRL